MSTNYHHKVAETLAKHEGPMDVHIVNVMMLYVMAHNPHAFLRAYEKVTQKGVLDPEAIARDLVTKWRPTQYKIQAIKDLRGQTKLSLRQSKDLIEKYW